MGTLEKDMTNILLPKPMFNRKYRYESQNGIKGTMILCGFGNASIAVRTIDPTQSSSLTIHFSWGLGAAFGVYVSKYISGGHINPAVTITKALLGDFPVLKMIPYILAQCLGAFASSCLVYAAYIDMELNETNAKIFATY